MNIKQITPLEVEKLEEGCREFYRTNALLGELNTEVWASHWQEALVKGYGRIWCVFDDKGEAVSALGGYIGPDQSNEDLVFTEKFYFARKIGKGTGLQLLREAEKDLEKEGVRRIYMINLFNYQAEKSAKIYSYLGYTPSEVLWVKEI